MDRAKLNRLIRIGPEDDDPDLAIFTNAPGGNWFTKRADGFAIRSMAGCWKENFDRRSSGSIPSGFKLYSYCERSPFVRFQRDLLR